MQENECQISQSYILHMKFEEFYLCNHNSCEIWLSFSRNSMRNFLWYYYRWFVTSLALEKCKKECNILQIILVQGFCPLKIKITQLSIGDSVLNLFFTRKSLQLSLVFKVRDFVTRKWSILPQKLLTTAAPSCYAQ